MAQTRNRLSGVDGPLFKQALLGSLSWLAANQEEVNRLNVFPVPDGDTGTNMLLTLQSAVEDIKESQRGRGEQDRSARIARQPDGRAGQLGRDPVADLPRASPARSRARAR